MKSEVKIVTELIHIDYLPYKFDKVTKLKGNETKREQRFKIKELENPSSW